MPDAFDRPLRVGVILDSLVVPRWVHTVVANLRASDYARIELVAIVGDPDPSPALATRLRHLPQLPFTIYSNLDHRLFRGKVKLDALAPTSAEDVLGGVSTMSFVLRRCMPEDCFADQDVLAVKALDLDVLVHLGSRAIGGPMLHAARHGVWAYHLGDDRTYRGDPPFFWEMVDRSPVSGTMLQILADDPAGRRVIYRSMGRTDVTSLFRNRNENLWKTARFLERRLSDLHRDGPDSLAAASAEITEGAPAIEIKHVPGPVRVAAFAARVGVDLTRAQVRHRMTNGEWFVAWARRQEGIPGVDYVPQFREVPSLPGHALADPFLVDHEGRTFAFVELCPHRRLAGVIAVLQLGDEVAAEPIVVLDRGYHMSYPAVFRWNDTWFMTPETSANRTVELYRAVEFPWRWELDTVLLSGVAAVDPTLFQHERHWWLNVNIASPGASLNDELHVFHADSPRGPFTPHDANPVISDVRGARPAGRPFVHDGALYRPSQNCAIRYGHSMTISRVDLLEPDRYREVPTGQILPEWLPGATCTHTLNISERYIITDGFRTVPRWRPKAGWPARPG